MTVDDSDEFHAYVASVRPDGKNDDVDAGQLPIAEFRMPEIDRSQAYVVESPEDVGAALQHFLGGDVAEGRSFSRVLRMKVLTNPWITANVERALDETPERLVFDDGEGSPLSGPAAMRVLVGIGWSRPWRTRWG